MPQEMSTYGHEVGFLLCRVIGSMEGKKTFDVNEIYVPATIGIHSCVLDVQPTTFHSMSICFSVRSSIAYYSEGSIVCIYVLGAMKIELKRDNILEAGVCLEVVWLISG